MKQNNALILVLLLGVIAFVVSFNPFAKAAPIDRHPPVQQWEHMAMHVDGDQLSSPEISRKIIGIGTDGWQLVDVETFVKGGDTTGTVYFFKRPKS